MEGGRRDQEFTEVLLGLVTIEDLFATGNQELARFYIRNSPSSAELRAWVVDEDSSTCYAYKCDELFKGSRH